MTKDVDLRKFHSLLSKLEGGALNEALSEMLNKAVKELSDACLDRGGTHKASITLTLNLEMNQKDKIVEITAEIKDKMPKAPRGRAGMFWCDSEGNLVRENPRQLTLEDELERQRRQREEARG